MFGNPCISQQCEVFTTMRGEKQLKAFFRHSVAKLAANKRLVLGHEFQNASKEDF